MRIKVFEVRDPYTNAMAIVAAKRVDTAIKLANLQAAQHHPDVNFKHFLDHNIRELYDIDYSGNLAGDVISYTRGEPMLEDDPKLKKICGLEVNNPYCNEYGTFMTELV